MFGYAPSNGISHGTKQSISMILAPKRWLEFAKRSVIVANWANTSPHFLLLAFRSLSARVAFHSGRNQRAFYLLNTGIAWIVVKARFLFLRPFQPLLFCFWWDPFVMSGHLLCSAEPLPAFKQTSASGTGLLVPWASESMTVPVMS